MSVYHRTELWAQFSALAHDSRFLLTQTLGDRADGSTKWIHAAYSADLAEFPESHFSSYRAWPL